MGKGYIEVVRRFFCAGKFLVSGEICLCLERRVVNTECFLLFARADETECRAFGIEKWLNRSPKRFFADVSFCGERKQQEVNSGKNS